MEIIKIGKNAMKISLCTEEAKELGFDNNQSAENFINGFTNLLVNIKNGFNYYAIDEKGVGEMIFGLDGECEIFVSKMGAQNGMYRDSIHEDYAKKQMSVTSVFSFGSIERLLTVAKRLKEVSYQGESSVYYDESNGKYYIFLEDVSTKDIKYAFISEYATPLKNSVNLHIKEHCKCICKKDGVKILSLC